MPRRPIYPRPSPFSPARTRKSPWNRQDGWRCLRVKGPLDFSLVGILAELSGHLARAGVPIFAVSTYNTDYVLIRAPHESAARKALLAAGYELR